MIKKALVVFVMLIFWAGGALMARPAESDNTAGKCMTCHKEKTPGLYRQWAAPDGESLF